MIGLSLLPSPHPKAFQRLPVRPSGRCYPPFSLDKGRSPGFASAVADFAPCSGSLSLRLRASLRLASPATATRGLIMQKARRHRIARLRPLAGAWFQGLFQRAHGFRVFFTPLPEVLFTFPSRYSSTVGLPVVFSLAGWSPRIHAGFLVSCATQVAAWEILAFRLRGSHPLWPAFPRRSATLAFPVFGRSYYPGRRVATPPVWASSAFARRYSRNHCCFLFLRVLRCFSSPRWPWLCQCPCGRVSPFGHPRISSYLPIPAAFRSLSRPSSLFADPRGFSQLVTSFLASGSLRHPPCALVCFPFSFPTRRGLFDRGCALALGFAFTLACTPCQ